MGAKQMAIILAVIIFCYFIYRMVVGVLGV